MTTEPGTAPTRLDEIRDDLAGLYRDLHAHPELSYAEHRTAAEVARRAGAAGYEVATGVGGTGVVAVLRNGDGPTVLLRADMDALPVEEKTGLPYASTATGTAADGTEVPVMHACGHDMHTVCLLGALDVLAAGADSWSGTVLAVFQPAEELATGAAAMVDDGLFERFGTPDVTLGQHVAPLPAGWVGCHPGAAFAATDSLRVRMFGRGGHGSRPETTVDPVVMAASTVMRLQTVVSREVAAGDAAVVTVGSLRAGTKENIIPDEAELQINVRSFDTKVRARVLEAVTRIVKAEAAASGADREPEITPFNAFPLLYNDESAMARTGAALRAELGDAAVVDPGPVSGSEDFGRFGTAAGAPTCYWLFGGADPEVFRTAFEGGTLDRDVPSNHSPHFAPVVEPTLSTGVRALTAAALAWLAPKDR
ncbi:amidohydrolase [Nocardiopsis potens]|uniref:amidohydrolase n=1 Tax=Nocardiopsis potens TaxID=1246458 RepID=UPI000348295C|nr:amidohydrolase [Nocardiopsis potens]